MKRTLFLAAVALFFAGVASAQTQNFRDGITPPAPYLNAVATTVSLAGASAGGGSGLVRIDSSTPDDWYNQRYNPFPGLLIAHNDTLDPRFNRRQNAIQSDGLLMNASITGLQHNWGEGDWGWDGEIKYVSYTKSDMPLGADQNGWVANKNNPNAYPVAGFFNGIGAHNFDLKSGSFIFSDGWRLEGGGSNIGRIDGNNIYGPGGWLMGTMIGKGQLVVPSHQVN